MKMPFIDLTKNTNAEIEEMINDVVSVFYTIGGRGGGKVYARAGFFQLNKEVQRRGLEISQTKFGKIILEPKKEAV